MNNREMILAPSILSADFGRLGEQMALIEKNGVKYLHIDVMDGDFVPSISFGMPVIKSIRPISKLVFDCHLMITEPDRYIDAFADAGADIITVHAEACRHLSRTLQHIHGRGLKAGVALNPATSLSMLDYCLDDTDMILLMTVNPGFGGQKLIPQTINKVRELRTILDDAGIDMDIEVDGGITAGNLQELISAGANVIVSGSSIFKGDMAANINSFNEIMRR